MPHLTVKSSYINNEYGKLFKSLISILRPKICYEFGILDGFSTIIIGHTLKKLKNNGHLYAYDLFDEYSYSSRNEGEIISRIDRFGLEKYITVSKGDLMTIEKEIEDETIDFMHVDISNNGDVLNKFFMKWNSKIKSGGCVLFEGGSPLRDQISWMKEYRKRKILPEILSNSILNNNYTFIILNPYPSLMICSKNIELNSKTKSRWFEKLGYIGDKNLSIDEEDLMKQLEEF